MRFWDLRYKCGDPPAFQAVKDAIFRFSPSFLPRKSFSKEEHKPKL